MDSIGKWNQVISPNIIPGVQAMLFDNQDRLIVHYDKLYRIKSDFSAIDTSWSMMTNDRNPPVQLLKSTWGSILAVGDTMFELAQQLRALTPAGDEKFVLDSSGNIYSFSGILGYGLVKSSDHGMTWQTNQLPSGANLPSESFVEATSYGFISDGEGEPEVRVAFDTDFVFLRIRELDENLPVTIQVDAKDHLQVFDMSGSNNDHNGGIWSSSDHGNTWRRRMSKQNIQGMLMEDGKYYTPQLWATDGFGGWFKL
jgi:hypothetical protein